MSEKRVIMYNKLVRDRIPEIIEKSGKSCVTRILEDDEYIKMLDAKLDEELNEYHKDQSIEELTDLLEVIHACAMAHGYTVQELENSIFDDLDVLESLTIVPIIDCGKKNCLERYCFV